MEQNSFPLKLGDDSPFRPITWKYELISSVTVLQGGEILVNK